MQDIVFGIGFLSIYFKNEVEYIENGVKCSNLEFINKVNGFCEDIVSFFGRVELQKVSFFVDVGIFKSTEDLFFQRSGLIGVVVKFYSIINMEIGGLKIYDIFGDDGFQSLSVVVKIVFVVDGKNIVRSKFVILLYDQFLQVFIVVFLFFELLLGIKVVFKFDLNYNFEELDIIRVVIVFGLQFIFYLYGFL